MQASRKHSKPSQQMVLYSSTDISHLSLQQKTAEKVDQKVDNSMGLRNKEKKKAKKSNSRAPYGNPHLQESTTKKNNLRSSNT